MNVISYSMPSIVIYLLGLIKYFSIIDLMHAEAIINKSRIIKLPNVYSSTINKKKSSF